MNLTDLVYEREGGVAKITLNRPDLLNSFNRKMALEFQEVLRTIKNDALVRAVLLTGAGRAFCAGQDLQEAAPKDGVAPDLGEIVRAQYNPIILSIRTIPKPFICAVNGIAAGAGANLALCCDIVLAGQSASFVQAFSKVGLIPDSGGTFFLPRLVGFGRASALIMLGEKVAAPAALAMGLIYKVCPDQELVAQALEIAKSLALAPTKGLGLTKQALNASAANSLELQLQLEEQLQQAAGRSADYVEGVTAFFEKRPSQFSGK